MMNVSIMGVKINLTNNDSLLSGAVVPIVLPWPHPCLYVCNNVRMQWPAGVKSRKIK